MTEESDREQARPSFVGIGQPLSGTSWIWRQFRDHKDTKFPPVKEMHFLDHGMTTLAPRRNLARLLSNRANLKPRELENLEVLQRYFLDPICEELAAENYRYSRGINAILAELPKKSTRQLPLTFRPEARHFDWYGGLFSDFQGFVTGEITPRYCILDEEVVKSLKAWAPDLRILMTVRHPVTRMISYLQKGIRRGQFSEIHLNDLDLARNLSLDNPIQIPFLQPTKNYQTWVKYFGEEQVRVFFLEDIRDNPEETRTLICSFLGLDESQSCFKQEASDNPKSLNPKVNIPTSVVDMLKQGLENECQECAKLFKGRAKSYID